MFLNKDVNDDGSDIEMDDDDDDDEMYTTAYMNQKRIITNGHPNKWQNTIKPIQFKKLYFSLI